MQLPVLLDISACGPPVAGLALGVRDVIRFESKLFFQDNSPYTFGKYLDGYDSVFSLSRS